MDKSYRIHTNIASDTVLNVNMTQDYDFLEVLTMKLGQKDAYKLHSSNYGVIIGRVLANDAFGIPNARISVFIERNMSDSVDIENIYPYSEVTSQDKEGRRYNLLPDDSNDDCYRIVGTFPNKRLLLDNDIQVEVYEKYWKYTTVTNNAGDYMIFGVPSGSQQIHVDLDLSDIGILSQKPRDFEYKGYNKTMFDNPNQFKESTNLDNLAQIFSQNKSVFVQPFWGDTDNGIAAITRCDVQIQYKFEPTCVFMGSIVCDNDGASIGHNCTPSLNVGMNDQLVAGEGTIEMIRKTQDGLVEEFQIRGNQLIDNDGVWCYQIPMNLDYIGTDEYGNIVPTDNPTKGIPTRTQVRFRISKRDTGEEGFSVHTAKYLVPMNPIFSEKEEIDSDEGEDGTLDGVRPVIESKGQDIEDMYSFGSATPQSCFRDLYWNNVYSVKNYIPKTQVAYRPYAKNYGALKGSNLAKDKNPVPFNSLFIYLPFLYIIICIIYDIISAVVWFLNKVICAINWVIDNTINAIIRAIDWIIDLPEVDLLDCVRLGNGLSDTEVFAPGCTCEDIDTGGLKLNTDSSDLKDLVVEKLADDFDIVRLDFEQDWLNGCLYMPSWFWRKRKKKTYLFGLIKRRAKNDYCDCREHYSRLKTYVTCSVKYKGNSMEITNYDKQLFPSDTDWHRDKKAKVSYLNGLIKGVENKDGLTAYYYAAVQATQDNMQPKIDMVDRTEPFYAIRLYATDIILLGNLNEENLYGIPQLFKVLPSTTANIPPIATVYQMDDMTPEQEQEMIEEEERREEERKEKQRQDERKTDGSPDTASYGDLSDGSDSGSSITSGMNWRHSHQEDGYVAYSKGLFMELACTEAYTKAKSCFNVERMSELGVNNDTLYRMSYSYGRNIKYGNIMTDGLISKLELEDMENRAMFATMNHIGFVPQEYQDTISGYTTQVEDENTSYLVPKFRYIYPVDFDGRMRVMMENFAEGAPTFEQHLFDEADQSYLSFRFGADADPNDGEHNRMRHFYKHGFDDPNIGEYYEMPLYNNSFYFYFGINQGSTAIDKFNNMFYSECFKNNKKPFTYNISSKGKGYCQDIYADKNQSFAYIRFHSDDIQAPYSYRLTDMYGNVIIEENGIMEEDVIIGGILEDEKVKCNNFGAIVYQNKTTSDGTPLAICLENDEYVDCEYNSTLTPNTYLSLENARYLLYITDVNGRIETEEIDVSPTPLSFDYEIRELGAKFLSTALTPSNYICDAEQEYYGLIRISKIYIDGYEFTIDSAALGSFTDQSIFINVTASSQNSRYEGKTANIVFELWPPEDGLNIRTCMCQSIYSNSFRFDSANKTFEFAVYQPLTYVMKMYIMCNGEEVEESEIITDINVPNGENFDARLNNMPIRFMLGKTNDSKFYKKNGVTGVTDVGLDGWYGVHKENSYKFSDYPTNESNVAIWANYVNIGDITTNESKREILLFKFNTIFSLSNAAYMTDTSNDTFRYRARGGKQPTMTRVFAPDYNAELNAGRLKMWKYEDRDRVQNYNHYPNIIGNNYDYRRTADRDTDYAPTEDSPRFNEIFSYSIGFEMPCPYLGNYFAAFTNNGRYTSKEEGNCNYISNSIPDRAAVNLYDGWKQTNETLEFANIELWQVQRPHRPLYTAALTNTDGACTSKTSYPHFRAMYVDRKLDYDLIVWMPTPNNIRLYNDDDKNDFLNNVRISGVTYNGIEMSYDEDNDYNIINVPSNETKLEYSYIINGGDAQTVYNATPTIKRRFYEAKINNTDIRSYFWSTFNTPTIGEVDDMYVFDHTNDTSAYNGNFDKDNYPTKRLIDVGNIKVENTFKFSLAACSYDMSPTINDNDDIVCSAIAGDALNLSISFRKSPIRILSTDSDEYANVRYFNTETTVDGYTIFKVKVGKDIGSCEIRFKFVRERRKGFTVYPRALRLIKVLDTEVFNQTDSITYIKNTPYNECLDRGGKNDWYHYCENSRIQKATMETFDVKGIANSGIFSIASNVLVDASVYDDVGPDEGYEEYFHNSKRMTINDDGFEYMTFVEDISSEMDKVRAFAILTPMDYYANDRCHTNHIKSIEMSEVFDARTVQLKHTAIIDGFTFKIKRNNNSVSPLEMLNQAFNEGCEYNCTFKNDSILYETSTSVSFDEPNNITLTTKFTNIMPLPTEIDEWAVNIFIRTTSNFLYKIRFKLAYSDNNNWEMRYIQEAY